MSNIVGFDTGGFGISQVVVTIATDDFEQGWDELAFLNSSARTETTETISGQTTKIWIYNDILIQLAWTAERRQSGQN